MFWDVYKSYYIMSVLRINYYIKVYCMMFLWHYMPWFSSAHVFTPPRSDSSSPLGVTILGLDRFIDILFLYNVRDHKGNASAVAIFYNICKLRPHSSCSTFEKLFSSEVFPLLQIKPDSLNLRHRFSLTLSWVLFDIFFLARTLSDSDISVIMNNLCISSPMP